MSYIYLNYSTRDQVTVDAIKKALAKHNFEVWQGESGESAIDNCTVFMVLMTPQSRDEMAVYRAGQYAAKKGKAIVPVLLSGQVFLIYRNVTSYQIQDADTLPEDLLTLLRDILLSETKPMEAAPSIDDDEITQVAHQTLLGKPKELQALMRAMRTELANKASSDPTQPSRKVKSSKPDDPPAKV